MDDFKPPDPIRRIGEEDATWDNIRRFRQSQEENIERQKPGLQDDIKAIRNDIKALQEDVAQIRVLVEALERK